MNVNKINIIDINNFTNTCKDKVFQLSKAEYDAIQLECTHYENIRSASIEALKIVQKSRGWVSDDALIEISRILSIPCAELEGIATFYNQIFRNPVGRYIIRYCDSVVCYICGCENIKNVLIDILKIKVGNTTMDRRFTLLPTCCLGACDKAPVVMINEDFYFRVNSTEIISFLEYYL